jgi:hypothetical protein
MVMGAEGAVDFADSDGALGARLPLPEEDEALSTHRATQIRGIRGAFAQNLHSILWPFVEPTFQRQRKL